MTNKNTSILEVLKTFTPNVKVKHVVDKPFIDSVIFRLHYRITTIILFVLCAFVTANTIFGEPIECVGEYSADDKKMKVVNTFCFLGYTYIIPRTHNSDQTDGTWTGIGQEEEKKYYSFYRWVPLMFFLQGSLFYLPHWIWKSWENKKITYLTKDLRGPMIKIKKEHREKLILLAKYAADSLHTHNLFALVYYFCEVLNFINVITNIYMIDAFLNGEFLIYGLNVLNFTDTHQDSRTDRMIEVFPRITKCDFNMMGPAGGLQNKDFLCVLPLNNLNEKIYIFLWFWLIILAFVSLFPLIYNVQVFLRPKIRIRELKKRYTSQEKSRIEKVAEKAEIGDFFLWDLMSKSMSSKCFSAFIDELHEALFGEPRPQEKQKDKSFIYSSSFSSSTSTSSHSYSIHVEEHITKKPYKFTIRSRYSVQRLTKTNFTQPMITFDYDEIFTA